MFGLEGLLWITAPSTQPNETSTYPGVTPSNPLLFWQHLSVREAQCGASQRLSRQIGDNLYWNALWHLQCDSDISLLISPQESSSLHKRALYWFWFTESIGEQFSSIFYNVSPKAKLLLNHDSWTLSNLESFMLKGTSKIYRALKATSTANHFKTVIVFLSAIAKSFSL